VRRKSGEDIVAQLYPISGSTRQGPPIRRLSSQVLRNRGVDTGVTAEVCVTSTVRKAMRPAFGLLQRLFGMGPKMIKAVVFAAWCARCLSALAGCRIGCLLIGRARQ
jgi:hypothetical protein